MFSFSLTSVSRWWIEYIRVIWHKQNFRFQLFYTLLIVLFVVVFLLLFVFLLLIVICRGSWFRVHFALRAVRNDVLRTTDGGVFFFGANKEEDYFCLASGRRVITLSYFSFSLAAFFSYGCLSSAVLLFHISPSFLAVSPIVSPGFSLFTLGRSSAQKRKNADLRGQRVRYFMPGCACCVAKENTLYSHYFRHTAVSSGHWGPWIASSCGLSGARNSSFPSHSAPCLVSPCLQICLSLLATSSSSEGGGYNEPGLRNIIGKYVEMCTDSSRFYLPALWAFLGKLCEVHRSIWVFLLMLLSACLHKVGIWGHFASGLLWILTHLVLLKQEKGNCAISGECFAFTLLIAALFYHPCLCQLHLLFKIGWWEEEGGG